MSRRILHLLSPAPFGGLESVVELLAIGQHRAGDLVSVAVLVQEYQADVTLVSRLRDTGVRVHVLATAPRRHDRQWRLVGSLLRDLRPNVLHTHGYVGDVMAWLTRVSSGTPHVSTVHGFTGGNVKNRVYEWIQCRSLRGADVVVAVSGKLAENLEARGVPHQRIQVIKNAWDVSAGLSKGRDESVETTASGCAIGWVGRISHEKGLDVLIDALPLLPMRDWQLTVVGDGQERTALEERVRAVGLQDRVTWTGAVEGASRHIPSFDVIVISSRTEGTPMTLLEAMSARVPIVTTRVGGIPDVVSDREAWLVAPEHPAELAEAIGAACNNRSEARARSEAARARLDAEFSSIPWLMKYSMIYEPLIARRPPTT